MINTILGSKDKMSQSYIEGTRVPVTWIKAGPCVVTQVKSTDRDGYFSVQIGFSEKRIKNVSKALQGHLKQVLQNSTTKSVTQTPNFQTTKTAPRYLREVRLETEADLKVGDVVKLENIFRKGDVVQVSGTSKGKGFAGAVKRWGFHGGPKTHGQSDRHRAPGSIGQGTTPGRVLKGKKMAGRLGNDRVTVKNLIVVDLDKEKGILAVSGPVPGVKGGLLEIKKLKAGSLDDLVEEVQEVAEQPEAEGEEKGGQGEAVKENKGEQEATKE